MRSILWGYKGIVLHITKLNYFLSFAKVENISKHFEDVKHEYSINLCLKDVQNHAANYICNGKDKVVCLPTGYGKIITMLLPPLLMNKGSNLFGFTHLVMSQ